MTTTITLTPREILQLTEAHHLLRQATGRHSQTCTCELCRACYPTSTQDMAVAGGRVPGVTA